MTDDIRRKQANLSSLSHHPGWLDLLADFERKNDLEKKDLMSMMLMGKSAVDLQRDIDFARGFECAFLWFRNKPANAKKALEKFLLENKENK